MTLDDVQIERYSRQILIPEIGGRGQQRLLDASVAIVGDGDLAAELATHLARAGIGSIVRVVDDPAVVVVDEPQISAVSRSSDPEGLGERLRPHDAVIVCEPERPADPTVRPEEAVRGRLEGQKLASLPAAALRDVPEYGHSSARTEFRHGPTSQRERVRDFTGAAVSVSANGESVRIGTDSDWVNEATQAPASSVVITFAAAELSLVIIRSILGLAPMPQRHAYDLFSATFDQL